MKQNNSIFTRVLALVLCMLMCAGILTACFQMPEFNPVLGSNGVLTPDSTTGNVGENTPNEDPENPVDPEPVDPNVIFSASTTVDSSNLILGTLTNDVVIGGEGATALVPADVVLETGASSLSLTLKNVEENDVDFGDAELLNNLDVHISGIAANNTVPMTVALGAILEAGLGATELKLYHIENGEAVLMTRVNSAADFAIHNQYVYNEETGEVTIYVASFSVFTAVKAEVDVWDGSYDLDWYNTTDTTFTLTTAEQLAGFGVIVDGGYYTTNDEGEKVWNEVPCDNFSGKTVKLATDIDLDGKLFNPIGGGWAYNGGNTFNGTFDGDNHTIYNLYVNGWELDATGDNHSGTSKGAGLFSSLHNATIQNLAVVGSKLIVETTSIGIIAGVAQGKCTFENIVVSDATLGNYQMRNGGIVGDIYVIESDNVPENEYSHTFTNIVVDSSVKLSSMWGDFDTGNGGVIGGKYGSSKVLMQNVIVAAELDVFSDVTAAYQWYAYRRCGMLVGYTGQNSPKQATNASADFLDCINVNVYYGDWVNYTYYQFANQDSSTGRRYPWVRAQESPYNNAFSNVRYGVPTHTVDGVTTKVSDLSLEELNKVKTGYAEITFNQLYGGGQGVYGTNEHEKGGVTTHNNLAGAKTIYLNNNLGWTNLKLYYWFANGDDTWTTLIDGIDMSGMLAQGNTYKIQLPAYAYGFKILADGENVSGEFILADLENNKTINLGCTHENTTTTKVDPTCTVAGSTTVVCNDCKDTVSETEIPATGVHTWGTTAPYACTHNCGEKAETKTIYFKNSWLWSDVKLYYWFNDTLHNADFPGESLKAFDNDGTYDYYQFTLPEHVEGFIVSGINNDGKNRREQTTNIMMKNVTDGAMYTLGGYSDGCDKLATSDANFKKFVTTSSQDFATYKSQFKVIYLKPNTNWTKDGARFAVYAFNSDSDNTWLNMSDPDKDGTYQCWVPTKYKKMIFCRMNGSTTANNWDNKWNQSGDLTLPTGSNNLLTMSTSTSLWDGFTTTWSQKK